jgi:LmbE family N-acetylglucosaminyl deacetylase
MRKNLLIALVAVAGWACAPAQLMAQALKPMKASDLQLALRKLQTVGSALYLAAHPDDENTRVIAYLAKSRDLETGYLSLTRGDGGQNLIGSEQGYLLGVIRTQELLAARRIDGGKQFFSTANDFGFSRNPQETLLLWDRDRVLADMVWVIRKFQPDVIVTRFPPDSTAGHGHHTSSSMLAEDAFVAAADPKRYPDQLKYVTTWQAKRLMWNKWRPGFSDTAKVDETNLLKIDVGTFCPLLGESYADLAMDSRTQHKSQGFGSAKGRGSRIDYLQHTLGERAKADLLEGVNLTWSRLAGGEKVGNLLKKAYEQFRPTDPAASLPLLLQAYRELGKLPGQTPNERYWIEVKRRDLKEAIRECAGLWFETVGEDYSAVPGDSVAVVTSVLKRANVPVTWQGYDVEFADGYRPGAAPKRNQPLATNQLLVLNEKYKLRSDLAITQPYWLRKPLKKGMFDVEDQTLVGLPENPPAQTVTFTVEIEGVPLSYTIPLLHKWTHRVDGELYRPFEIIPEVTANIKEQVYVFSANEPKDVAVTVKAGRRNGQYQVALSLPPGWRSEPATIPVQTAFKEEEKTVVFKLFPSADKSVGKIGVVVNGQPAHGLEQINYPHIPIQTLFPLTQAKVVKLDIKVHGTNLGYYEGAGDEIPASLRQVGYTVTELNEANFDNADLAKFDAIITGIRAYNAKSRIKFHNAKLLEYVKNGGTLIVQYNVNFGLVTKDIGPYPFRISRDRVTIEEAPVVVQAPQHPLLNLPNQIGEDDYKDWVQERGLYFADQWDKNYQTLIACTDPGRKPLPGGLLYAKYGNGAFIYTGYAFFRQLPAGVPGAYRLFANLIAGGKVVK